jgi:Methyltransferase domain
MPGVSAYRDPLRPTRLTYVVRALRATARDPFEGVEKAKEKLAGGYERARHRGQLAPPPGTYRGDDDWERRLHEVCGAPWPCPLAADFTRLWVEIVEAMAHYGLRVGRQNYGGDDDGDPGLVRAGWCLTRHLSATNVLETGVGHGITSRGLLEALAVNGAGHLWSIDLPPLTISARNREIGVAVPERLRGNWSYLHGSSRRRLPGLLARLGEIDLFVHDSRHTTRNVLFECERAFAALRPGGFLLVDDLDANRGFARFAARHPDADLIVAFADDHQRLFGVARKRPVSRA